MFKLLKDTPNSKAGDVFDNAGDAKTYIGPSGEKFSQDIVEVKSEFFVNVDDPEAFLIKGAAYFYIDETGTIRTNVYTGQMNFAGYPDEATYVKMLGQYGNLFQDEVSATTAQSKVKTVLEAQPKTTPPIEPPIA